MIITIFLSICILIFARGIICCLIDLKAINKIYELQTKHYDIERKIPNDIQDLLKRMFSLSKWTPKQFYPELYEKKIIL